MRVLWMDPREVYYARVFRHHRESSLPHALGSGFELSMPFTESIPSSHQLG